MYNSGTSYDRIGPNTYATNYISEQNIFGTSAFLTTSSLQTLQIVSPTRMVMTYNDSRGGCTTSHVVYLDFVRDDPNVRCGKIIDMTPFTTPWPTQTVPTPARLEDPPMEGEYAVRLGIPAEDCDAQAKALAPNFQTATLSFSPEKNLSVQAPSARYEFVLTGLPIVYNSAKTSDYDPKLGAYKLEQPLADNFQLMMNLIEMPGNKLAGNWFVTNSDGSQMCTGSMDLTKSK